MALFRAAAWAVLFCSVPPYLAVLGKVFGKVPGEVHGEVFEQLDQLRFGQLDPLCPKQVDIEEVSLGQLGLDQLDKLLGLVQLETHLVNLGGLPLHLGGSGKALK